MLRQRKQGSAGISRHCNAHVTHFIRRSDHGTGFFLEKRRA